MPALAGIFVCHRLQPVVGEALDDRAPTCVSAAFGGRNARGGEVIEGLTDHRLKPVADADAG